MTIPDYQALMLPVLKKAAQRETRVPELADSIANELGLTQEERDVLLPSGRQRLLHNRIHWAKFYMSKAGLIESPRRGHFIATEAGKALLESNPPFINVSTLMKVPSFQEFYTAAPSSDDSPGPAVPTPSSEENAMTPEERISVAHQTMSAALRTDLLERIAQNTPSFFEQLIIDLLVAMGYGGTHENAASQLGRTGDGGVDGVINEDRLGLDRIYVQAKRFTANTVGRPEVQAFVGSLVGLGATKGVFVTTSTFSSQARDFVKHLSQRVILIDGQRLAELMIEHGVGVRTSRTIQLQRLDEDFFSEED